MIPKYVSFSSHDKDGFLSQHGNFTGAERTIFQRLCNIWDEKIPYNTALAKVSSQSVNSTAALQALMSKLQSFGLGLIRHKVEEGNMAPDYIVLVEEQSSEFFYELIEEFTIQALLSPSFPLPLSSELRNRKIVIPKEKVRSIKFTDVIHLDPEERALLRLHLDDRECMFCTSSSIPSMIDAIILKLRYFLRSDALQKKLQQLMKISPSELIKQLRSLDSQQWSAITHSISAHKQEMFGSMERAPDLEPYYYACFLSQYLSAQAVASEKAQEKEEKTSGHFNQILQELENNTNLITNRSELDGIVKKYEKEYGEGLQEFYQSFISTFVKPFTAGVFPSVLSIEQGFIHQNNIFRYFYEQFLNLQQTIIAYCEKEMQTTLSSATATSFFLNRSTLEEALKKAVREYNSFVAVMLEKPSFFAEAIVHHAQHGGAVKNVKGLEKLLGQFFRVKNMELKSYVEIFEVNSVKIFRRAFTKISIFTRIWWNITGKMASLEEKFHHAFQKSEVEEEDSEFSSSNLIHIVQSTKKHTPQPKAEIPKQPIVRPKESSPESTQNKSQYSSQQIDEVWKNFQKSLDKD